MDALPALAAVEDLLLRLARDEFADLEEVRAAAVLEDVSEFVREESRKDWLTRDADGVVVEPFEVDAPRIVRTITLRCAERAIRNPEGFSSESAGDYSYQRNGATGEGGIYLTERELKILLRAGGNTGLWTQPITRDESWYCTEWVNDQYGYEPIPYAVRYDC